jgi:hypothetical protein
MREELLATNLYLLAMAYICNDSGSIYQGDVSEIMKQAAESNVLLP